MNITLSSDNVFRVNYITCLMIVNYVNTAILPNSNGLQSAKTCASKTCLKQTTTTISNTTKFRTEFNVVENVRIMNLNWTLISLLSKSMKANTRLILAYVNKFA